MTRVILIRPGSTDFDEQRRIQGTLDVPLNEHGAAEARQLADELRADHIRAIYCSCGTSARNTAEAIAEHLKLKAKRLENLRNLDQGLWQGLSEEEVRRKHPKVYKLWKDEPLSVCPPGGEMLVDAYERVRKVLKPVLKRHTGDVIGIVVPEPLLSIIHCYLSRLDLAQIWQLRSTEPCLKLFPIGD